MDDELNFCLKLLCDCIDVIDVQLIVFLNQCVVVVFEVGEVKKYFNVLVFWLECELQVIVWLQDMSVGLFVSEYISVIWCEIMVVSCVFEQMIYVVFFGLVGMYSEQVMFEYFGQLIEGLFCLLIDEVFCLVEVGVLVFGIVLVENLIEGVVLCMFDLLLQI